MFKHALIAVSLAVAGNLLLAEGPASGAPFAVIHAPSNFQPTGFPHKWEYVGPRSAHRSGPFRYYYGGWWYPRPWWYGPGSSFAGNPISGWWDDFDWAEGGYTEGTDPHVEWCFDHHHSYEEATDSFLGHDGAPHRCRSPFD